LAIIHPKEQLDQYKLVFSLLFRIKKIEFLLNYTWRQSATLQHALSTTAQYNGITVSTNANYTTACALLRKISILRQSMMHLIINLKSYLMFEVLEGGWLVLEKSIQTAKTLDQVIEAHDNYLSSIVTKSFIRQDQQQQQQGPHILSLLEIATQFCHLQEALFRDALLKADLATQQRLEAELLQRQGQWGFADSHDTSNLDDFFGLSNMDIFKQVEQISQVYNHQAILLLQVLGNVVNGGTIEDDEDVYSHIPNGDLDPQRFLMAQLDHNQYYASQQQRQEQAAM
jgi:gamma-tubulin complex component 3